MAAYKTFSANVKHLLLQLHASGAENGTVLQHVNADGVLVNVVAAPGTIIVYTKHQYEETHLAASEAKLKKGVCMYFSGASSLILQILGAGALILLIYREPVPVP